MLEYGYYRAQENFNFRLKALKEVGNHKIRREIRISAEIGLYGHLAKTFHFFVFVVVVVVVFLFFFVFFIIAQFRTETDLPLCQIVLYIHL